MATAKNKKAEEPLDDWTSEGDAGVLDDSAPPEAPNKKAEEPSVPEKPSGPKLVFGKYAVPEGSGRMIAVCERDFSCHIAGNKASFLKDEEINDPAVYQDLMKQQKPVRLELK